jgi:hypothetical protein
MQTETENTTPDLSDAQFSTMLVWLCDGDTETLSDIQHERMVELLNQEAVSRGFEGCQDAYHEYHGRHKTTGR